MRWHVAEPVDAGGLEADVGVEAAGDGTMDDGLLLFLQQGDETLLGTDVALNPPVHMVKVTDNDGLLGEGWNTRVNHFEMLWPKAPHIRSDAVRPPLRFL